MKQIIKTPVGEINITPVQPNETIIEAVPERVFVYNRKTKRRKNNV